MITNTTIHGTTTFETKLAFIQHEVKECKDIGMHYQMYKDYMAQWGFESRYTVSERQYEAA